MKLPQAFRAVMIPRTIADLQFKMKFIRKVPQDTLIKLFLDMCDSGIELYIQTELQKNPLQSRSEIMKKFYLNKKSQKR